MFLWLLWILVNFLLISFFIRTNLFLKFNMFLCTLFWFCSLLLRFRGLLHSFGLIDLRLLFRRFNFHYFFFFLCWLFWRFHLLGRLHLQLDTLDFNIFINELRTSRLWITSLHRSLWWFRFFWFCNWLQFCWC